MCLGCSARCIETVAMDSWLLEVGDPGRGCACSKVSVRQGSQAGAWSSLEIPPLVPPGAETLPAQACRHQNLLAGFGYSGANLHLALPQSEDAQGRKRQSLLGVRGCLDAPRSLLSVGPSRKVAPQSGD